jgi:hypothetical protein
MIKNDLDGKYKPSSLTAYERYEALIPILSEASEAYVRFFSERPSEKRDTEINSRLTSLFDKVSSNSSMGTEEVRRAFQGYTARGISGLMTPTPIAAEELMLRSRGTWELTSRVTNGGQTQYARPENKATRARSKLYYEMASATEMKELVTMWNEENHYPREESLKRGKLNADDTFFIAAFSTSKFRQVDDYTVEYTSTGEFCGNHEHYRDPKKGTSRVLIMQFDGEPTFLSIPEAYALLPGGRTAPATGTFLLLNYYGGSKARGFAMSGLPPMFGDTRTMDVYDNYVKVSDQQPLVGGWEPIESYYSRLRNLPEYYEKMSQKSEGRRTVHGFYAEDRQTLKRYDLV